MIIVNADDWGRTREETDASLECFRAGRITSVTAMVFMSDSCRAAAIAREEVPDVGLHLNVDQSFDQVPGNSEMAEMQGRLVRFLADGRYASLRYAGGLRNEFRRVIEAQFAEFARLYGRPPMHVDGHHHMHLSANVLFDRILPVGIKVRRNFTYRRGEKGPLNRAYRGMVDSYLRRNHRITDYLFSLSECLAGRRMDRVFDLARHANVELMVHPVKPVERAYLMSSEFEWAIRDLAKGTYASI